MAIENEKIIAALISNGTIKAAAESLGISTRTINDRLAESDFRADYNAAKSDIVRQALFNLNSKLADAIETVSEIMKNEEVNPATRLQAAQTIISNAAKFTERLTAEEDIIAKHIEDSTYQLPF